MKSLMRLLECVLADAGTWCCASTTRDFETVTRRVEHEGISFLTICLPTFARDFERSLALGKVDPSFFLGFKKNGELPRFLGGFLDLVFHRCTGVLLDEPDVHAIFAVRQICLLYKKALLSCSGERERKAYDDYVQCEHELTQVRDNLPSDLFEAFRECSRLLWGSTLQGVQSTVLSGRHRPKHGPGATCERISGNQKYVFKTWHERLQPFFPADAFTIPNLGYCEQLQRVEFIEPEAEMPVRVITVPKTLKSPRIIAIEPVSMQYTQQSLLPLFVGALESKPLTRGRINFTDQKPNQESARLASITGDLATIDLKEASDRVSVFLVESMLEAVPFLRDAVLACRSTKADVPGKGIYTLSKFASMGSALCFPIEAMVFYTVYLTGELRRQGLRCTTRNLEKVSRGVRVYGDDIIIPVSCALPFLEDLKLFGFKANLDKSFWTGKFRESCGADWYDGIPVKPVYCRRLGPKKRQDASEILSWISMANQFYLAGYWNSAQFCRDWVGHLVPLPIVEADSPIQGRTSLCFSYKEERICPNLHRPLVRGVVVSAQPRRDVIDDSAALLKCLLKEGEPFRDVRHLERFGRPDTVNTKVRWAVPY